MGSLSRLSKIDSWAAAHGRTPTVGAAAASHRRERRQVIALTGAADRRTRAARAAEALDEKFGREVVGV